MNVIDQFKSAIPLAVSDGQILQQWLLHFLFPGSYPLDGCRPLLHDLGVPESYKTVAARGYAVAAGVDFAFVEAMNWLCHIKAPIGLVDNEPALLGLALGLRHHPHPDHLNWWQAQLHQLPATASGKEFERFLESVRDPERNSFPVVSLLKQQAVDSANFSEEIGRNRAAWVLALASGILRPVPHWDRVVMAEFLIVHRKRPFPYTDDFLRNMLTIKVEDFALAQLILSPEEKAAEKARHFAGAQEALGQWADRRGHRIASLLSIVAALLLVTSCTLLFVTWPHANETQDIWDILKWATVGLGGPVQVLLFLAVRLIVLVLGRPWKFDYSLLQQSLSRFFIHRWQRRLKLPLTT